MCAGKTGGKDNYPVDRAVGESMIAQLPNVRLAVQWNRAFLRRVVRYLIREAGIIAKLLAPFPAGSHVAISHATPEWRPDPGDEVPGNAAESYYCVVVACTN